MRGSERLTHPVLHHGDLVRPARGREPVRDEDDRLRPVAAGRAGDLRDGVEDVLLRVRVQG